MKVKFFICIHFHHWFLHVSVLIKTKIKYVNKQKTKNSNEICMTIWNREYFLAIYYIFTDVLAKVTMMSKQNQKPESEPTVRKRQTTPKETTHTQACNDYTKEQLEHIKRYLYWIKS